ncbi:serine/threonine-protein kinase HAL4/sat4 [Quaeritorhiza haematococci]|nr:serine/threonine-protein kinase HAL4/sat4 [Quaeritorhiza haematococci]
MFASCSVHLTPEPYIAPEAFVHSEYDGQKVDVWACGVIYYAMRYCSLPWRRATPDDGHYSRYLKLRPKHEYRPLEMLEEDVRELMKGVLDPEPGPRWTVQEIMSSNWLAGVEGMLTPCARSVVPRKT